MSILPLLLLLLLRKGEGCDNSTGSTVQSCPHDARDLQARYIGPLFILRVNPN